MTRTLFLLVGAVLALTACTAPPPAPAPSEAPPAAETRWEDPPEAAPTAIRIAAIAAESSLIPLGTGPDGAMIVPDTAGQASWWTDSPKPGETGPAVILGHINQAGQGPGVFARLGELQPGDVIAVGQETGNLLLFGVYRVERYSKQTFDQWAPEVLGDTAGPELRVISCGGQLNQTTRHYEDNIVAFARELP